MQVDMLPAAWMIGVLMYSYDPKYGKTSGLSAVEVVLLIVC